MTTILTHKIALNPTFEQISYFKKACGTARFAWNWALAKWEESYKQGGKPSAFSLKKEFNALKTAEFPWVYEVTKYACQQPFIYLQKAYSAFLKKKARKPKFKKKGLKDSFYIGPDQVQFNEKKVKIPLLGWVKLKECLRFDGKIQGITISLVADRWFISVQVEIQNKAPSCESQAKVGIDLGISKYATCSDGKVFENNRTLLKEIRKVKRDQRALQKKKKGSRNYQKAKVKIARRHYKISCKRLDFLHKMTSRITDTIKYIAIEDLSVSKMLKDKRLSFHIADCSFYEFKRQLCYKALLKANSVFIADPFFASSKRCSCCGSVKDTLGLSERVYICNFCGIKMCRDLNAAKNLEQLISTASSAGIYACGQDGSTILMQSA